MQKVCKETPKVSSISLERGGEEGGRRAEPHTSTQPREVDAVEEHFSLYYQEYLEEYNMQECHA